MASISRTYHLIKLLVFRTGDSTRNTSPLQCRWC